MGYFRNNNAKRSNVAKRKSFTGLSAVAIACMTALATSAKAEDELLQFERVSPPQARAATPVSQAATVSAQTSAPAGTSEYVVRAVLESLATPSKPAAPESKLEFVRLQPSEPLPERSVDMPVNGDMAGNETLLVEVTTPPGKQRAGEVSAAARELGATAVKVDWTALANQAKATATSGMSSPSERELRQLFLHVVEAAAAHSPAIKRAMAERGASEADVAEAKGQRYPQVQLGAQGPSWQSGGNGSKEGSLSLDIITPVFDWGRIRRTVDSRNHLVNAADSALAAEMEASAFDVTGNMIELGKQRIIVSLGQRYVDRMGELVSMLEGIVAIDAGRVSELTQARARLLQAEASRSTAHSKVRDIEINLRKLIGDRPLPTLPDATQWNVAAPDLQWLLAESATHPSVLQARAQARSADSQADAVRSALLPQVNWVVGKSTADDGYGRESSWHTGLTLSWNAFRGGSGRAAERAARMRADAGWMSAEQQLEDMEYRIRAGNQDANSMAERAELYQGLSIESNKVREAFYEQWYHLGRRTLLDVLSSETEHYNNQVGEVTNRFDSYQAVMRQYSSAGALVRWLDAARS